LTRRKGVDQPNHHKLPEQSERKWLDNVHLLTPQRLPKQFAIISLFEMLKVEVDWSVVAVLAGLGWLYKVNQLTLRNSPKN
jgi:hypothetical protein